jgi:hypothetical protein
MIKRMLAVCVFLLFVGSTTPRGINRTKLSVIKPEVSLETSVDNLADVADRIEAKAHSTNNSKP